MGLIKPLQIQFYRENVSRSNRVCHYCCFYRNFTGKLVLIKSAGIGGGPILNICLMLGLGYDTKNSMSITYVFLMGGAFASMWKSFDKKNPKTGGPIIDYDLVLLTLPAAVSGSLFGVF